MSYYKFSSLARAVVNYTDDLTWCIMGGIYSGMSHCVCVRVCVCVCVRACVRACVHIIIKGCCDLM